MSLRSNRAASFDLNTTGALLASLLKFLVQPKSFAATVDERIKIATVEISKILKIFIYQSFCWFIIIIIIHFKYLIINVPFGKQYPSLKEKKLGQFDQGI